MIRRYLWAVNNLIQLTGAPEKAKLRSQTHKTEKIFADTTLLEIRHILTDFQVQQLTRKLVEMSWFMSATNKKDHVELHYMWTFNWETVKTNDAVTEEQFELVDF